jgi:hypothetical protein
MAQFRGFFVRIRNDLCRRRTQRQCAGLSAFRQGRRHMQTCLFEIHAEIVKYGPGDAMPLGNQAEQDVFAADVS